MDQEQAEVVGALVPALIPVVRVVAQDRMRKRRLEHKKETGMELIEARNQAQQTNQQPVDPQQFASDDGDDGGDDSKWDESIRRVQERQDCEVCEQLLDGVMELPPEERGQGLTEFGRFRQSIDDTQDMEKVREELEGMPALKRALEEEFG